MEDQGIMALPQGQAMQAPTARPQAAIDPKNFSPQISDYARMQPEQFGQDILGGMEAADPAMVAQFKQALAGMQLPPEVIDFLGTMVDGILSEPENYEQNRAELLKAGIPEEILPPTFDAAFFAALNIALDQLSAQQAPVGMKSGGIMALNPVATELAKMGRGGDRMLAHITPSEARMLRRRGGAGTINPSTGLREYGIGDWLKKTAKSAVKFVTQPIKSTVKAVGNVVKKIASSPLGKIALTAAAIYFMGPAGLNIAAQLSVTNAALATSVNAFAGSTLVNLASGQSLKDSIKGGAVTATLAGVGQGLMSGFDTTVPPPSVVGTSPVSAEQLNIGVNSIDEFAGVPLPGAESVTANVPTVSNVSGVENVLTPNAVSANALTPDLVTANAPAGVQLDANGAIVAPESGIQNPIANLAQGPSTTLTDAVNVPGASSSPYGFDEYNVGSGATPGAAEFSPAPPPSLYEQYVKPGVDYVTDFYKAAPDQADIKAAYQKEFDLRQSLGHDVKNPAIQEEMYRKAVSEVTPTFGTMSRVAGTGIGALALTGAFSPQQPKAPGTLPKETGFDLLAQQPDVYSTTPGGAETVYSPIQTGYGGANVTYSPINLTQQPTQSYQFNPIEFQQVQYPSWIYSNQGQTQMFAQGGIAALAPAKYATGGYARGGIGSMANRFPRRTGPISGPGTGTSDSIPAMLSDGEFVMTAKAVRGAGGGSRREGARRMYQMMRKLERNG